MYENVLKFWFEEIKPDQWWVADPAFDQQIRERFAPLLQRAMQGELYEWRANAKGRLAEIIVLDQFSRNIFRNTSQAFAQDAMALVLSQHAVAADVHKKLSPDECVFLLLPFMHSESRKIHEVSEKLFREFTPPSNYDYELKHKAIVDRFGRYPHRNAVLGRTSTTEEIEFLKQPGSSF